MSDDKPMSGGKDQSSGTYPIQKNIPIPKTIRKKVFFRRKYEFETMDVGDMFFVPNRSKNTLATHASTVGRALGKKFITKLAYMHLVKGAWVPCEDTDEGATLGIGVWRVA